MNLWSDLDDYYGLSGDVDAVSGVWLTQPTRTLIVDSSSLLREQQKLVAMTFVTIFAIESVVDSNESLFQTEPGSSGSWLQLVFEVSHLASHLLIATLCF